MELVRIEGVTEQRAEDVRLNEIDGRMPTREDAVVVQVIVHQQRVPARTPQRVRPVDERVQRRELPPQQDRARQQGRRQDQLMRDENGVGGVTRDALGPRDVARKRRRRRILGAVSRRQIVARERRRLVSGPRMIRQRPQPLQRRRVRLVTRIAAATLELGQHQSIRDRERARGQTRRDRLA